MVSTVYILQYIVTILGTDAGGCSCLGLSSSWGVQLPRPILQLLSAHSCITVFEVSNSTTSHKDLNKHLLIFVSFNMTKMCSFLVKL